MCAAGAGHLELVRYLAGERAAATDAKSADGFAALMCAAEAGHLGPNDDGAMSWSHDENDVFVPR